VPDRYDRPAFWTVLLDDLEAWLKADAGVVVLLTKADGVDVAQGLTPTIPAPCVRLLRGDEGEQPLTGYRFDSIPQQVAVDLALCAQSEVPATRDSKLSARSSWDALGTLEAAVLASLRRYFSPERDLSATLGAPFWGTVKNITPTDGSYWPVVGSTISILLNRKG
jgi:hypothetical protein